MRLIELGPGRGTMMLDALRAAKAVPGFRKAIVVHLVEISPALEKRQRQALGGTGVPTEWHKSLEEVPPGPSIILANEFFDALPVQQAVMCVDGWHERVVKLDDTDRFQFSHARDPIPLFDELLPAAVGEPQFGDIFEWRADQTALELGRRVERSGGAALVLDYGHVESATGDTCRRSAPCTNSLPLKTPGQVDPDRPCGLRTLAQAAESMDDDPRAGRASRVSAAARHRDPRRRAQEERYRVTRSTRSTRRWRVLTSRDRTGMPAGCSKPSGLPTASSDRCRDWTLERLAQSASPKSALAQERLADACRLARRDAAGICHAFFTRHGGVSDGIYASLNGGVGSNDVPAHVAENRARMAEPSASDRTSLLTAYQIHSPDVVTAGAHGFIGARPKADALVTRFRAWRSASAPADCGPILLADGEAAGVVGAAHAGWRGALSGVAEATISAMERCGADRDRIVAAVGPLIRQPNYESGRSSSRFLAAARMSALLPAVRPRRPRALRSRRLRDAARLAAAGIRHIEDLGPAPMRTPTGSSAIGGRSTAPRRTMVGGINAIDYQVDPKPRLRSRVVRPLSRPGPRRDSVTDSMTIGGRGPAGSQSQQYAFDGLRGCRSCVFRARNAIGAAQRIACWHRIVGAVMLAFAAAGCSTLGLAPGSLADVRGTTIAFES